MSSKLLLYEETISIRYDYVDEWLYVEWKGDHSYDSIVYGCNKILQSLKEEFCHKVLNSSMRQAGSWSEAAEWVALDWLPRMEAAGLKYFAWVYPPNTFSQMTIDKVMDLTKATSVVAFPDMDEAKDWLRSQE